MSYSSDYDARGSRRRLAGCGCLLLGLMSVCIFVAAMVMLGVLGDCGAEQPDCHAAADRALNWLLLALLVANIAIGSLLGWWQSRSRKR